MIGARIQQARHSLGLSLRDLAGKAEISAMAISKYERDEITPSSEVLLRLAKALGVRSEYFFRQQSPNLEAVNFRKHEDLPERDRSRVLADARDQLERWLELEQFIPTTWSRPFELPEAFPRRIRNETEIERAAELLRDAWGLGRNPISNLVDTLESNGIKVFSSTHVRADKFNGLSARVEGKPLIIVGENWPGDRQRFTLAHELGHLAFASRLVKQLDEEKACNRFAAAFLVPEERARAALGERRTRLEPKELALLKEEWGFSMAAWARRARDLDILSQARSSELRALFKEEGWQVREPGAQYQVEHTRLFDQLVFRALAEDLISESKAAELLGISVSQLRRTRHMEGQADAPRQ